MSEPIMYVKEHLINSEFLGQFIESDLGCMLDVVLRTKKLHSVRRKNIVPKHDSQSH